MKLQSMTDFVLEKNKFDLYKYNSEQIREYAKTLKLKPELWMFVACDDEGNVLEEPICYLQYLNFKESANLSKSDFNLCKQYQQAKENVLFEGLGLMDDLCLYKEDAISIGSVESFETIEDLIPYNLETTENFGKNLLY